MDKLKSQSYGVAFRTGPTAMLGDLGGGDGKGRNTARDLNPQSTRWMVGVSGAVNPMSTLSGALHFNFIQLAGNDFYTDNPGRNRRNLHVETSVIELNPMFVWKRVMRKKRDMQTSLSAAIGPGFFHFTPRAYYKNRIYSLPDLNTEGQNFRPGIKDYRQVGIGIPFYLAYQRTYQRSYTVSFELHMRKLFTDYLDDVSNSYADNQQLIQENGTIAGRLADPNLTLKPREEGTRRGNPGRNDTFMYFSVSLIKTIDKNRTFYSKANQDRRF